VQDEIAGRIEQADQLRRSQLEHARYEAELARRRYFKVDPDNRLVAETLEADWNERLAASMRSRRNTTAGAKRTRGS
jgi:hypothetical protein